MISDDGAGLITNQYVPLMTLQPEVFFSCELQPVIYRNQRAAGGFNIKHTEEELRHDSLVSSKDFTLL